MRRKWLSDMIKDSKTSDLKLSTALKNVVSIIHQVGWHSLSGTSR